MQADSKEAPGWGRRRGRQEPHPLSVVWPLHLFLPCWASSHSSRLRCSPKRHCCAFA